jgi:hypothetical protein
MRRKTIIASVTAVAILLLGSYTYLSAAIGRCLNPSQFVRFSTTIAMAITHPNKGGARRAFSLYRQAMTSPSLTGSLDLDGQRYVFPLPKYAVPQEHSGDGLYFRAFVSPNEMENYFYRELPQAGWTHDQQLGAGHFFHGHGVHLTIVQHFYLTSDISEFHVVIDR